MREHCDSRPFGLTLLELLVVITLMGLVAATVTTRIGGGLDNAAMGQAVAQWEFTDQHLRLKTRRSGRPATLYLKVASNRMECAFDEEDDTARTLRTLGRSVKLGKVLSSTHEVKYGPAVIRYSGRGTTETFAIELIGKRKARRWLMVAGVTGQITEVADESQAKQILEVLLPPSLHAG